MRDVVPLVLLAFASLAGCSEPTLDADAGPVPDTSPRADTGAVDASESLDAGTGGSLDAGDSLDGGAGASVDASESLDAALLADAPATIDALLVADDAFVSPDVFTPPDASTPPDAYVAPDAFAARVDTHVHIEVDNTCRMTVTPREATALPGQTLYFDWHNHSRDYPVDVWMSYGGGYTDLATGATWDEPIGHCSTPFVGDEYADITTACSSFRFLIHCR